MAALFTNCSATFNSLLTHLGYIQDPWSRLRAAIIENANMKTFLGSSFRGENVSLARIYNPNPDPNPNPNPNPKIVPRAQP